MSNGFYQPCSKILFFHQIISAHEGMVSFRKVCVVN